MKIDLNQLDTEKRNQKTYNLDQLSSLEIVETMNNEDLTVPLAIQKKKESIAKAIDMATNTLKKENRIIYIGAGTSGRLGILDAVECVPTFGIDSSQVIGIIAGGDKAFKKAVEGAEDSENLAIEDLKEIQLRKGDLLIGLAASGRTPYVLSALRYGKSLKVATISISCTSHSEIGKVADLAIDIVTGPEVLTGSTRLKAGTAQKMVLNMISTGSFVQIGKSYSNLMVDVVPTNKKLEARALQILKAATGVKDSEAKSILKKAQGNTKVAITMALINCTAQEAARMLSQESGNIKKTYLKNLSFKNISNEDEDIFYLWNKMAKELNYVPFENITTFKKSILDHKEFDKKGSIIVYDKNKVIAMVLNVTQKDYLSNQSFKTVPGYILAIYVIPEYRNKGIGQELLEKSEDYYKEMGKTTISISHKNPIKLSWYIRNTEAQHNKAPGIKINSLGYHFLKKRNYFDYSLEDSYYRDLKDFHISNSTLENQISLAKEGYIVTYYDETKHKNYKEMFLRLKDPSFLKKFETGIVNKEKLLIISDSNNNVCGTAGTLYKEESGRGFFSALAIDPIVKGKGLGTVLFANLCNELKKMGANYMTLFVTKSNYAKKIYEKEGFQLVEEWSILRKEL